MLVLVLVAALVLRLAPLLFFSIWGSDTGEYVRITRQLAETGSVPRPYEGWGVAYPSFPGMEILGAQVVQATGLDTLVVLQLLVPALNVLTVAATFLIGRRLWSRRAGLWSAGVVAVAMPTVFTGSHPMPESLAHGLALVAVFLYLDADRPLHRVGALGVGLGVVVTHHLTTYFLLLGLGAIWLGRVLTERTADWERLSVLVPLGLATVAYWIFAADAFRVHVLAPRIPPVVLAVVAAVGTVVLAVAAALRTRIAWTLRLPTPDPDRAPWLGAGLLASVLLLAGGFMVLGVPGLTFRMDPATLPWYLPLLSLVLFVPLGTVAARRTREVAGLYLWIAAIGGSFVAGALLLPTVLLPYRHIPFLTVPMALLVGAGIADRDWSGWRRAAPAVVLVLLAATAYPPPSALGGFQEGITSEEMAAVGWADRNLPEGAVFLADHRLSSMLFGMAGMQATWDSAEEAWYAPSFEQARPTLAHASTPAGPRRVDYVIVSPVTEEGVALEQWDRAEPLTGPALAKFGDAPFQPIYDRQGVRIYRIAWE